MMEQGVIAPNSNNYNEHVIKREIDAWFHEQNRNINQTHTLHHQLSHDAESPPIVTATSIQWWKDTSITDMVPQSDYQYNEVSSINSSLNPLPSISGKRESITKVPTKLSKSKCFKEHQEPPKRTKHPELWKVNVKKNARLRGEEYVGVGGKIVPAKSMGPPCNCRMRCSEKINEKAREELHTVFWKSCNWEQRKQCIALSVKETPKQRTRCRGGVKSERRREVTFAYSLLLKEEFITVCKRMFLSTFALSEKFVRYVMEKKRLSPEGIIGPGQRGKHTPKTKKSEDVREKVRDHIRSFPAEKSVDPLDCTEKRYLDSRLSIAAMHKLYVSKCKEEGVPESDVVKESYYREMFKTEFNLGFKRPESKENN